MKQLRGILLFVALVSLLAGCSKKEAVKEVRGNYDWVKNGFVLDKEATMGINSASIQPYREVESKKLSSVEGGGLQDNVYAYAGNKRYALQSIIQQNETEYYLYKQDFENTEKNPLTIDEQLGGGSFLAIDAWKENTICGLWCGGGTEEGKYIIYQFTTEGELLEQSDVTVAYTACGIRNMDINTANHWYMDKNGYSYVINEARNGLWVFDENGEQIFTAKNDNTYQISYAGAFHAVDGGVIIQKEDMEKRSTELLYWDMQKQRFQVLCTLDMISTLKGKGFFMSEDNYIYYVSDSAMIVKWDIQNGAREGLFSFMQSSIKVDDISAMACEEDGSILLYLCERGETEAVRLWNQQLFEGERLTIAKLTARPSDADNYMAACVSLFPRENPEYPVEYRMAEGSASDFRTRIMAEVVAGEGPDMLWVSGEDMRILQKKGVLEDLTVYLSDEVLEQIFPGVIESGIVDGQFVGVMPTGTALGLLVSDNVWEKEYWTMANIMELLDKPEVEGLFTDLGMGAAVSKDVFWHFVLVDLASTGFVDLKTGISSFDCGEFKRILTAAKEYGTEQRFSEELYQMAMNGEYLMMACPASDFMNFSEKINRYGKNCHWVGFPGQTDTVGYWESAPYLVVSRNTSNKEAVSRFLEHVLSKESQSMTVACSVREDVIRDNLHVKYSGAKKEYRYTTGGADVIVEDIKEDGSTYIEEYIDFLRRCGGVPEEFPELNQIVLEEAEAYFNSERELQETVDIIQNRVQLYLDENK